MFLSLTRILLLLVIGAFIYYVLVRFIPSESVLGRLGAGILLVFLLLAFFIPRDSLVSETWNVISFPLKPLGGSIVLLFFATQKRKDISGRNLMVTALLILLFASVPAVAYIIARIPQVAMVQPSPLVYTTGLEQGVGSEAENAAFVVANQTNPMTVVSSNLSLGQASLNFPQSTMAVLPMPTNLYLLQTRIRQRRGLRPVDFVPSAEMLALSTRVWDNYLASLYYVIRGQQAPRGR